MDTTTSTRLGALSLADWRYSPTDSRRDLRLDFLRGMFLVFMLCYHYQRAWVIRFTYEFWGNVSSAEGFVFVSGMVVGLVYLPMLKSHGVGAMVRRVWRRALHLYLADIVTLGGLVLISAFLFRLQPIGKLVQKTSPLNLFLDIVTLRFVPFGFDILFLYIGLLIFTPLVLWLIYAGRVRWVILGSVTLFILYRFFPELFAWQYVNKNVAHFPIMLWQVLFVGGIVTTTYREHLKGFWNRLAPFHPALIVTLLFLVFFIFRQLLTLDVIDLPAKTYNYWFNKSTLGVGRLVNFVVIAIVLYWFVTNFWQPLARSLGKILIPLGQASLYVFVVHLFFAYFYRTLAPHLPLVTTGIYELVSVLILWVLVKRKFLFQYVPH